MATNGDGVRSDGTQVRAEQLTPLRDTENIATTPEENSEEPIASASEHGPSEGAGNQTHPGDVATSALQDSGADVSVGTAKMGPELPGSPPVAPTSSVELDKGVYATVSPSIEPASVVAEATVPAPDEAAARGELTTGERTKSSSAETIHPQAGRGAEPPVAAHRETAHQVRKVAVGVLVVLSCLGLLSSALVYWANQTLLNTNQWVQIVGPVAQDPQVVSALSAYAADQTVQVLNVQQRVQNALPDRAAFLAVPITQQVHDFVQRGVARGMNTPAFERAWITINTGLHKQLVAALRGESQYATISNNTLTLDLVPLIGQALHQLQQQGPGIIEQRVKLPDLSQAQSPEQARQELSQALGVTIPANFGQVEVVQSDQLATAQLAVKILDTLVIVLPLVTLALLVATVWLSVNRRRTLIELGIGIVIAFVVTKILIAYFQQMAIGATKTDIGHAVAASVIPAALDSLVTITTWLLVIGVVLALVAYLVGLRQREWINSAYVQVRSDVERMGRRSRR